MWLLGDFQRWPDMNLTCQDKTNLDYSRITMLNFPLPGKIQIAPQSRWELSNLPPIQGPTHGLVVQVLIPADSTQHPQTTGLWVDWLWTIPLTHNLVWFGWLQTIPSNHNHWFANSVFLFLFLYRQHSVSSGNWDMGLHQTFSFKLVHTYKCFQKGRKGCYMSMLLTWLPSLVVHHNRQLRLFFGDSEANRKVEVSSKIM